MLSLVEITAFRLESKFPPIRALEFIRNHVNFKLPYDSSYQMKSPNVQLYAYEAACSLKKEYKIENSVKISNKFSYYNPNMFL